MGAGFELFFTALETEWPANRTLNLVFHGHSVPAGYHRTPEVKPFRSYPHLVHAALKKDFPVAVVNCIVTAIGGENSIAGAKRFECDVLSHRPDVLFIDYALNDRREPLEAVEKAWRSMIEKAVNIPLVLVTPTGAEDVLYGAADEPLVCLAAMIRRLGDEYGVRVADVYAKWEKFVLDGSDQATLLSQINHPNFAGHKLAAEVIYDTLLLSSQTS